MPDFINQSGIWIFAYLGLSKIYPQKLPSTHFIMYPETRKQDSQPEQKIAFMNRISTHRWPKSLKNNLFAALLLSFGWFTPSLIAQTCTYTIEMFENYGIGWSGGFLTVNSNGTVTTHTLLTGNMGNSSFEVTNGKPLTITYTAGGFAGPSYMVYDASGDLIFSSGPPPLTTGTVFSGVACCASGCDKPNADLTFISMITDSSAFVNWANVAGAQGYLLEYGPSGFPPGAGLLIDSIPSNADLTGLNPCVDYDFYLYTRCSDSTLSCPAGPLSLKTKCPALIPGGTCTYTLEFFDSFGDGWNGASLTVQNNGNMQTFTLLNGFEVTHTFTATSNTIIDFSYTAGSFADEVTYNILDPNGQVIFSDGPFPTAGPVFSTLACPSCPGPVPFMKDVNADNATVAWNPNPGVNGTYIVEYGPFGFTLGTGTVLNIVSSQSTVLLSGLQENTWYDVYVSLDCGTEASLPRNPVSFKTLWLHDVGVSTITMPNSDECDLGGNEMVTIGLRNYGQKPETLFEFFFAVNGVPVNIPVPQDGLFTGVVGNDSTQFIAFETTYDFSAPGYYLIEAWTKLDGDSDRTNDTFRLEINTAYALPLMEDFEDGTVDPLWINNGSIFPPDSHNNESFVLGINLWAGVQNFALTTKRYGVLAPGDQLSLDYRFVDYFEGTQATDLGDNTVEVQISDDCGESFETIYTIDESNHTPTTDMTTLILPLDQYEGKAINLRLVGAWSGGDYWLDIDNINITGCPANLGLEAQIVGSPENEASGSITLIPHLGTAPFSYSWDIGSTGATINDLPVGVYEVTVTDAAGCQQASIYQVGYLVGTDEVAGIQSMNLYPNPTADVALLDLTLVRAMDVQLRLLNTNGQVVYDAALQNVQHARQELDLAHQPPGLYIVQVVAQGRPYYAKLMVAR
ncbi:MAG: T9SS type A sorting domain-containing protein [Lewinellaceae bacterium]|nr:T9SS type A sorting domain-containing protein [Saprospiraceae bacterium]MCB9337310.1 T9SS type A sorting domain-containing protein [Lewinellaceae bacterium]